MPLSRFRAHVGPRLVAALALLSSGWGCRAAPAQPTLVLIVIDTLRADHLPAYGYRGVATPALDRLRADSLLFEQAYAHVPLTLPSHATLLTGRLPARTGVRDNLGYHLSEAIEPLALSLQRAGYATGAAVSSIVLARGSGLERGFELYDDQMDASLAGIGPGDLQRDGRRTTAALVSWLERQDGRRPIFAFLHLYEPHYPYAPPEPFKSRASLPYDGEIASADAVLGDFLDALRRQGRYADALIVLASDHGEGLGEHGEPEHGVLLYREALHVPLLLKLPGGQRANQVERRTVGLTQVHATLLRAAGLRASADEPAALDALPEVMAPVFSETLYPRLHFGWSELTSLVDGERHLIDGPRPELYDLHADPAERHDLARERRPELDRMRLRLEGFERGFAAPAQADPARAERLAALGYLSGGVSPTGPLPDPKDRIGVIAEYGRALALGERGDTDAALALLTRLTQANPGMLVLYNRMAALLVAQNRADEAARVMRAGLRQAPAGSATLLLPAAEVFLRAGQPEEALRCATTARELGEPLADLVLGRLQLALRRWDEAERSARRAAESSPVPAVPLLLLARVQIARGDLTSALGTLERAEAVRAAAALPPIPGERQLRGDVLLGLQRADEARQAYEQELEHAPGNLDAWVGLAVIEAKAGRRDQAARLLERMYAATPGRGAALRAAQTLELWGDVAGARDWRRRAVSP
jgi:choline-sulfatase